MSGGASETYGDLCRYGLDNESHCPNEAGDFAQPEPTDKFFDAFMQPRALEVGDAVTLDGLYIPKLGIEVIGLSLNLNGNVLSANRIYIRDWDLATVSCLSPASNQSPSLENPEEPLTLSRTIEGREFAIYISGVKNANPNLLSVRVACTCLQEKNSALLVRDFVA